MPEVETSVHPTAVIDITAELGVGVRVGPYAVVEGNVRLGDGVEIASHALIASGTRIGRGCRIFKGAAVGCIPQDLKFGGEETELVIGENTTIREFATLNRGTSATGKTEVGSDCLIMAYVHVAHDCVIGNNVILANAVNMAGHIRIEDYVTIGGMVPIHQFVRIGTHAFIGGLYRVTQDVPPYALAAGEPLVYRTPNIIGLKRKGFSPETIKSITKAYKLIYDRSLPLEKSLKRVADKIEVTPEIKNILEFFESSERGVIRASDKR